MHYPPQLETEIGRTVGAEALIRWRRSESGLLLPREFIEITEEPGLIDPIGQWVLNTAGRQAAGGLKASARKAIDDRGLDPTALEQELTESSIMSDPAAVKQQIENLKTEGVRLSLDDFGTGHSNLSTLPAPPFDILKVDRSFLADVPDSRLGVAIVLTILDLARRLGPGIAADGIKQSTQHELLRHHACRYVQGFLHARPLPADAMARFISE